MRQWCLTLFAGYCYWISPFLRPACRFVPTCPEYTSAATSRYGVHIMWMQACAQPSAELVPISSWRNGSCEVIGAQSLTSG